MRSRLIGSAIALGLTLAANPGCGPRTMVDTTSVSQFPGDDAELDFWQQLETQRVLSNDDALHGLLLLADGTDATDGFDERLASAVQRGWVAPDPALPANESARMGMLAVAVCDVLEIKGGLTMRVFGPSQRYCTRELIYREIIPPRTDNQSVSGLEFLDLIARAEEELEAIGAASAPPAVEEPAAEVVDGPADGPAVASADESGGAK
jgi:hypothetical protein